MQGWVGVMSLKRTETLKGAESKLNKTLKLSAADIFMCTLLKTVVSFQELCLLWADWMGFIDILCFYQHTAVVRVPVVLADNTATPFLTALIIIQSASSPVARPAATPGVHSLIAERLMALLYQHTLSKNTTRKAATSAARSWNHQVKKVWHSNLPIKMLTSVQCTAVWHAFISV